MKKDVFKGFTKEEQTEALKEFNIAREEAKKENMKNFIKAPILIVVIVIIVIFLFRIFIGTIELYNPFGYEKNRFYKVMFNDKTVTVPAREENRIPLIPWAIYFNSIASNRYDGELEQTFKIEKEERYILNINSYSCYDEKLEKRIACKSKENYIKEKNQDTVYTLKIEKRIYIPATEFKDEYWEVFTIYDGPFIEDITKYIEDGAEYNLTIIGKYGMTSAEIYFNIDYNRGY